MCDFRHFYSPKFPNNMTDQIIIKLFAYDAYRAYWMKNEIMGSLKAKVFVRKKFLQFIFESNECIRRFRMKQFQSDSFSFCFVFFFAFIFYSLVRYFPIFRLSFMWLLSISQSKQRFSHKKWTIPFELI